MAATTTMPYFKLDSGKFLQDTMGLSHQEVGIYCRTMAIYWESGCKLPSKEMLKKKLSIGANKKDNAALDVVLEMFFPDGTNEHLDACLQEAKGRSKQQSENAKQRYAPVEAISVETEESSDF